MFTSNNKTLWPTHVIIRQYENKADINLDLKQLTLMRAAEMLNENKDLPVVGDQDSRFMNLEHPAVEELKGMFLDAFKELGAKYHDVELELQLDNCSKVTVMKQGEHKKLHTHSGVHAFGIYYVDVGDAGEEFGGKLGLYDPKMPELNTFRGDTNHEIIPEDGMLVVAPGRVYHEVTPYKGNQDRIAIVCNCYIKNDDDL